MSVCEVMLDGDGAEYMLFPICIPSSDDGFEDEAETSHGVAKEDASKEEDAILNKRSARSASQRGGRRLVVSVYSAHPMQLEEQVVEPELVAELSRKVGITVAASTTGGRGPTVTLMQAVLDTVHNNIWL
jgi:hypothetical protein